MVAALIAVAATIGAGVAGGTTGAATSATAKPRWLTVSGFWDGVTGPEVVDSASGRGWMGFISQPRSTFGSVGRARGRLSFARTSLAAWAPMFVVGSQLAYHLPDVSGTPGELRAVPLLANGKVGTPSALQDDPEKIPPQELSPVVVAGIPVGGRSVWALTGNRSTTRSYLWACCSTTGELSSLTQLIPQGGRTMAWQLGLDAKGRLWLAWLERGRTAVLGSVKIVELDPATLAPRTAKPLSFPDGGTSTGFVLTCGTLCRLVASQLEGQILTWSPGERSPITMAKGTRDRPAALLAASDRSGHLAAAFSRSPDPTKAPLHEIAVVVGDARGAHARRTSAVALPDAVGPSSDLYLNAYATFAPGGLVYFAFYYPGGTKTRVLVGVLPIAG